MWKCQNQRIFSVFFLFNFSLREKTFHFSLGNSSKRTKIVITLFPNNHESDNNSIIIIIITEKFLYKPWSVKEETACKFMRSLNGEQQKNSSSGVEYITKIKIIFSVELYAIGVFYFIYILPSPFWMYFLSFYFKQTYHVLVENEVNKRNYRSIEVKIEMEINYFSLHNPMLVSPLRPTFVQYMCAMYSTSSQRSLVWLNNVSATISKLLVFNPETG